MNFSEFTKRFGIGLTGNIATGKSTVANILRNLGYTVIDADVLSRIVVEPKSPTLAKVVETFSASVLQQDGQLDRKKLAGIIFGDESKKAELEKIIHPAIQELLEKQIQSLGLMEQKKAWFYEASLLVESGSYQRFRALWCTYCSEKEQLKRLTARDKITPEYAAKIMSNQLNSKEKMRLCDMSFNTEVGLPELEQKIKAALTEINFQIKSQFTKLK